MGLKLLEELELLLSPNRRLMKGVPLAIPFFGIALTIDEVILIKGFDKAEHGLAD